MEKLIDIVFSRDSYSALFKAGILLVGISLLGMSKVGPFLYEKDIDAQSARFNVENISGKPLETTDCKSMLEHYVECRVAKHKASTLGSGISLLDTIVRWSLLLGEGLVVSSFFIFLITPFKKQASRVQHVHVRLTVGKD